MTFWKKNIILQQNIKFEPLVWSVWFIHQKMRLDHLHWNLLPIFELNNRGIFEKISKFQSCGIWNQLQDKTGRQQNYWLVRLPTAVQSLKNWNMYLNVLLKPYFLKQANNATIAMVPIDPKIRAKMSVTSR